MSPSQGDAPLAASRESLSVDEGTLIQLELTHCFWCPHNFTTSCHCLRVHIKLLAYWCHAGWERDSFEHSGEKCLALRMGLHREAGRHEGGEWADWWAAVLAGTACSLTRPLRPMEMSGINVIAISSSLSLTACHIWSIPVLQWEKFCVFANSDEISGVLADRSRKHLKANDIK